MASGLTSSTVMMMVSSSLVRAMAGATSDFCSSLCSIVFTNGKRSPRLSRSSSFSPLGVVTLLVESLRFNELLTACTSPESESAASCSCGTLAPRSDSSSGPSNSLIKSASRSVLSDAAPPQPMDANNASALRKKPHFENDINSAPVLGI